MQEVESTGSGQVEELTRLDGGGKSFAIRGIGKARENIVMLKGGKIHEDLLFCHACREVPEDIVDGNAHATDARLAATLSGFNR